MLDTNRQGSQDQADSGTITLVDVLAIALRWRKLILLVNLFAVSLAILAYLIVPAYNLAKAQKQRVVEVTASLMLGPVFGTVVSETEGANFLLQSVVDPKNILESLLVAGYESIGGIPISSSADRDEALFMIRSRVLENKGLDGKAMKESSRIFSHKLDKGVLTLVFRNGDPEKGKVFLDSLVRSVENELRTLVTPYSKSSIDAYERLLAIKNPSEMVETSIANDYRTYDTAKRFLDGTVKSLIVLRDPYVLVPVFRIEPYRDEWMKRGLILIFGVFFMSFLAAFSLQYVDSVKKDPLAMAKIDEALNRRR